MKQQRHWLAIGLPGLIGLAMVGAACGRPGGPFAVTRSEFPVPDAGTPPPIAVMSSVPPTCTPAKASEVLPPRSTVVGQGAASTGAKEQNLYFTADLYGLFKSVCGGCHVDSNRGNFVVTASTFATAADLVSGHVYDVITSDDQDVYMPPADGGGIPWSRRLEQSPDDAVVQLADLLDQWAAAGYPRDAFPLRTQSDTSAGYVMTAALGAQLTNVGSCVPNRPMVGTSTSTMDQLDAMFAAATALPSTLDQTDLSTLDSAVLAQNGVISYAPTYPLWSDNAKKMRYIRVPRGMSVKFDKAAQTFKLPPNTRFYKTFLKQVTDESGHVAYRKIETRVIVARDDTTLPDGSTQQNALYGTYVWNDDETQATLLNTPLRNGKPFADRLFSYVTDEQKAAQIAATNPANLQSALNRAGVTRHYALPGAERCVQCHMGSPSADFILGFTPLQVVRRQSGEGGTYEPAVGDELTQLQRLIDYGVITGVSSPADILPLERSEGRRTPRNQQELAAQAYMVGNCAHCHNPRGFPSIRQPELKDILIFLPGPGDKQGIFQFPLESLSPIRRRGLNQDHRIPYITPSLYDLPSDDAVPKYFCPDQTVSGSCVGAGANGKDEVGQWILAPWRSLIYRNTDSPYDYFDDYAPFPHMPLDTSGYDCRVAKLMGDWMVSIPSRVKHPNTTEGGIPLEGKSYPANANTDAQPYEEAFPGDADYASAVGAAQARLASYHSGPRYSFCPSTYTADIIDPLIQSEADSNLPVTSDTNVTPDPANSSRILMPLLTPLSPHYVAFDDTDVPGPWFPRRPDWESALVNPDIDAFVTAETKTDGLSAGAAEDLANVMTALLSVKLDAATRAALTQAVPYGLWDTTPAGCNFNGVPTAGSYTGANRPVWMTLTNPSANAPVLVETPGAAVFNTICFNCHGVQADSKGLLADAITNMTGGAARVANFRDGILGPLDSPGANRQAVYGPDAATLGLTSDDLAARYMAWMALGGTQKHLPQDVLTEVSEAPVFGTVRANITLEGSPDMLKLGLSLCEQIVSSDGPPGTTYALGDLLNDFTKGGVYWSKHNGLIDSNGDAAMWLKLCNLNNRPVVRVPLVQEDGGKWTANKTADELLIAPTSLYYAVGPNGEDYYGANPVLNERGTVDQGIDANNMFPICIAPPSDPTELAVATAALNSAEFKRNGNVIPFCPKGFLNHDNLLSVVQDGSEVDYVDGRKWAARGAINAALAVFLYLDDIERNPSHRQPLFTQCNLLNQGSK
jgi:mono/diheme cytochrome c family protein